MCPQRKMLDLVQNQPLTTTIIKINLDYLQRSLRIFFNMIYKKRYEHKVAITDIDNTQINSLKVIQEDNILKF